MPKKYEVRDGYGRRIGDLREVPDYGRELEQAAGAAGGCAGALVFWLLISAPLAFVPALFMWAGKEQAIHGSVTLVRILYTLAVLIIVGGGYLFVREMNRAMYEPIGCARFVTFFVIGIFELITAIGVKGEISNGARTLAIVTSIIVIFFGVIGGLIAKISDD